MSGGISCHQSIACPPSHQLGWFQFAITPRLGRCKACLACRIACRGRKDLFCETTFSWPILNLRRRWPIHFLKPAKSRTTQRIEICAKVRFRPELALRHKELLKA